MIQIIHVMATIYYHDIGDYLSREQKLKMVRDFRSIKSMEWTKIVPNEKRDWINVRDGVFDGLIKMESNQKFDLKSKSFFNVYSRGYETARDAWVYNSSQDVLKQSIRICTEEYNRNIGKNADELNLDPTKISWSSNLVSRVQRSDKIAEDYSMMDCIYRPYYRQNAYNGKDFVNRKGQFDDFFPKVEYENLLLIVPGIGSTKPFSPLLVNTLVDLGCNSATQCFPLYWYEKNPHKQKTLFDDTPDDDYIRHDGITDWILKEVRNRYNGAKNITKEMIFYYVYGLLHSKDYRERFAADLKKSLPRIPIVERIEDFMAFYKAGKQLAELHLNYEEVPPHPEVVVHITAQRADQDDYDYFRVDPKMKFRSKDDKSVILYNANIRLENIPLKAYDYIVNGKSAIEWIVERYCVSIDKKSLIKNDANDWAREHGKPRYILDLLLSVINVSTQTVDIVNNLPHLTFD